MEAVASASKREVQARPTDNERYGSELQQLRRCTYERLPHHFGVSRPNVQTALEAQLGFARWLVRARAIRACFDCILFVHERLLLPY